MHTKSYFKFDVNKTRKRERERVISSQTASLMLIEQKKRERECYFKSIDKERDNRNYNSIQRGIKMRTSRRRGWKISFAER
jgi:hypothetical protein